MTTESVLSRPYLPVTASLVTLIALASFNILAVVGGIPQITAELGRVDLLGWVVTGFLVTSTLATLATGPLIDSLGIRFVFRVMTVVFVVGSVACAAAPSLPVLIIFRGLQGLGGGLIFAVTTSAVGLAYPEHLRPKAVAAASLTWGVMAFAGPALGALLVTTTGWRGIFIANVPFAIGAALLGWTRLPGRPVRQGERAEVDVPGGLLLGVFTVISLLGVSSLTVGAALAAGISVLLAVAYGVYSGRRANPFLARRYFMQEPLGVVNVAFGLAFGAALGIDAYLPVYVRGGLHFSEEVAAFSVAFLTAGWTVGSLAAVRLLRRFGEVRVAELAFLALIPPLVVGISIYGPATPIALVFAMAATLGLGIGILSQAMLNRLFRLSEPAEVGRSSSAHQYMRGLFQTYASALAGAVLLTVAKVRLGDVEPVRRILAGEVVEASEVQAAVAEGFRRAHWVPLVFTLAAAAILARSRRAERIRARSG